MMEISRVRRTKEEARETYDRISGWYDLLEGIWEKKPRDIALRRLGVKKGENVLDIGFGTGHGIISMAQSVGMTGKVYGLDISPRMIDITRIRLAKSGFSERTSLICGDAERLPFRAEVFDGIFMSFMLELIDTPDIPVVLNECLRILKDGGRICVVSLSMTGKFKLMRSLYEWGHRKFPKLLDCRPIFVRSALESSGFQTSDATRVIMFGLPVEIVIGCKESAKKFF